MQEVSDLTGSDKPEHLAELSLQNKYIDNLGSIGRLTNLTELSLAFNEIISLAALASCVSLQSLNIMHNKVRSLSGLEELPALRCLKAGSNRIANLTPLRGIVELEELWLQSNRIKSLRHVADSLSQLPALEKLVIAQNDCLAATSGDEPEPCARQHLLVNLGMVTFLDGPVTKATREEAVREMGSAEGQAALQELLAAQVGLRHTHHSETRCRFISLMWRGVTGAASANQRGAGVPNRPSAAERGGTSAAPAEQSRH
jgi:hypothetical protein